jgi:hypothetical protein
MATPTVQCSTEGCTAPADGQDGRCWPCTRDEIDRRHAALVAQHPTIGRRIKGLRTKGYNQ